MFFLVWGKAHSHGVTPKTQLLSPMERGIFWRKKPVLDHPKSTAYNFNIFYPNTRCLASQDTLEVILEIESVWPVRIPFEDFTEEADW